MPSDSAAWRVVSAACRLPVSYSTQASSSATHPASTRISRCCFSVSRWPWSWVIRRSQARPSVSSWSAGMNGYSEHSLSAITRRPFSVASSRSERCNRLTSSSVSIPVIASTSASVSRLGGTGNIACVTVPNALAMIGW